MQRIYPLRPVLLLFLVLVTTSGIASNPEYKLHLVCTSGDRESPQGTSSQIFSERISELSEGRIKVNVFYQNELGGQGEAFDQLLKGNFHFMLEWPMTAYDRRLAIGFVPYLVLDWEDAISAFETGGWLLDLMAPIYAENNLKFLGPYPEGFGGIATRGRFATNAQNASGIKVRSQTIFPLPQTVRAMGFEAVPIDWSEVYTSIQTGVVNGDSGNVIYWDYQYFGDILDYYVHSRQNFAFSVLIMNHKAFDELSEKDQKIVETAASEMVTTQFINARQEDEHWIKIAQENGMKYIEPEREEIKDWIEKVRGEVWPLVEEAYGSSIMDVVRQNASIPN